VIALLGAIGSNFPNRQKYVKKGQKMRFKDKVSIVTGGAKGIGRATVEAFAREGACVVAVDIDAAGLDEVVGAINAAGGKALAVAADVSKDADAQRIAAEAVRAFGGIDYLCNIAGVQTYGTVVETDEALWDRTMDINLKSIYLVSRYCIPEIARRGGGAVVNMASVQGLASQTRVAAYAASKAGAISLTRTMAQDHAAQNIRVNCVCPGSVDTPLLRFSAANHIPGADPAETLKEWGKSHPLGRVGQASEIAAVILFLCSEDASFMTGGPVLVDGGLMAKLI
jgi:NAD(P)-dependent dehydrogenase (short-subunit alcohol dehydrogenase family)